MTPRTIFTIDITDDPEICNAGFDFIRARTFCDAMRCAGTNELREAAIAATHFADSAEELLEKIRREEAEFNGDNI